MDLRRWTGNIAGVVLAMAVVPLTASAGPDAEQGWNLHQQAADACEEELTLRIGSATKARDPHAQLDSGSLDFQQQGRNNLVLQGGGSFRGDRFDRGRAFTFDCTVDIRNGNTRANFRWAAGTGGGGNDELGWTQPPSYRPPPSGGWGSGGTAYPPTGRVFYSGGIINRASGRALDVQGGSTRNSANVQQWDFAQAPNQLWNVVDQGNGHFSIISQSSSKALDVQDHNAADGANIQQFNFANGDNQLWRLQRVAGGYYQIVSVSSGKCLDVDAGRINENGANIQQWSCSGQANQQWKLGNR